MRRYTRLALKQDNDHFLLFLGNHSDLSHAEKQNIIDLANILNIKKVSLSILSFGDDAEVAFLRKLSEKGNGLFNLVTNSFQYKEWAQNEFSFVNARKLADINVSIKASNGAKITESTHESTQR